MSNPIHEAIYNAWLESIDSYGEFFDEAKFEKELEREGFMIVPIEDPTNLFGIQEDSL